MMNKQDIIKEFEEMGKLVLRIATLNDKERYYATRKYEEIIKYLEENLQ